MHYSEFTTWSPTFGAEVVRLSMVNALGEEYFSLLVAGEGREWRTRKAEALDVLSEAIEAGMEPGEYRWR